MTKAVCMSCGELKFGAYIACPKCSFTPETLFDLTMSEIYSDHYYNDNGLQKLSVDVKSNRVVLQRERGRISVDPSIYVLLEKRLADQSFRDMLTLVRRAKDGIFRKELNMHLIGPDGYESRVSVRGKDLDKSTFDAVRSAEGRDLYLSYHYEAGERNTAPVSKKNWYILYDKMKLVGRQVRGQSAYVALLDGIYDAMLDNYLRYGTITVPKS